MATDPSIFELMPDEITIEPFTGYSATQAPTYGAPVTYRAMVASEWSKRIGKDGREVNSSVRVIIPGRVHIDPRDRITLPSGWVPNQPPIISAAPYGGVAAIALDNTEVLL